MVNDAVFKNSLREPLAIDAPSLSNATEMSFEMQPNPKTSGRASQMAQCVRDM
jgi:hypothetical protein